MVDHNVNRTSSITCCMLLHLLMCIIYAMVIILSKYLVISIVPVSWISTYPMYSMLASSSTDLAEHLLEVWWFNFTSTSSTTYKCDWICKKWPYPTFSGNFQFVTPFQSVIFPQPFTTANSSWYSISTKFQLTRSHARSPELPSFQGYTPSYCHFSKTHHDHERSELHLVTPWWCNPYDFISASLLQQQLLYKTTKFDIDCM